MSATFRIRPAQPTDIDALIAFAQRVGPGMTTLPPDRDVLAERIEAAVDSFGGRRQGKGANYLFFLEDCDTNHILGCSAVYPGAGADTGFFSYRATRLKHRSDLLGVDRDLRILHLVNDLTGATEVGTLIVDPDARRFGVGRALAKARYLLIAQFPHLFSGPVFAELRGWQDSAGRSPFWSAVGERFFGLDFETADRRSAVDGTRFIQELMPKFPIYTDLLPADAREVIGRPHDASAAAMQMLAAEGFTFADYVDVFDAGPQMTAAPAAVRTVRESGLRVVQRGVRGPDEAVIASTESLEGFTVAVGRACISGDEASPCDALRSTLQVAGGERLRIAPLRSQAEVAK